MPNPAFSVNINVNITTDTVAAFRAALDELASRAVAVGFPEETSDRRPEEGVGPITNPVLGFIHDKGSPAANIPARPFMEPGILSAREDLTNQLLQVGQAALDKKPVEQGLHQVGLLAQAGIRNKIDSNIPPPLKKGTLAARRRRGRTGTLTLQDTGQMRNAVNYIVYNKRGGA